MHSFVSMARERHSSWRQISFLRAMGKLRMSAIGRGQKGRFGGHKHKEFGKGWRELAKEDLNKGRPRVEPHQLPQTPDPPLQKLLQTPVRPINRQSSGFKSSAWLFGRILSPLIIPRMPAELDKQSVPDIVNVLNLIVRNASDQNSCAQQGRVRLSLTSFFAAVFAAIQTLQVELEMCPP